VRNDCFEVVPGDLIADIMFDDGTCGPETLAEKAAIGEVYSAALARR
jgi:hypothetical protein